MTTISIYTPHDPSSAPVFADANSKVKGAVNYVAAKAEKTVSPAIKSVVGSVAAMVKLSGKFPKQAQKFQNVEAFQVHQEGISRSPVSYLLGKADKDGKSFDLKRRVFDIALGSTIAGLGEFVGQIGLFFINLAKVAFNVAKAGVEKLRTGSVKSTTKANLTKAAKNTGMAFGSAVREAVRSVPIAGHFLAKAADTIALMGKDLASAAAAKANHYAKLYTGEITNPLIQDV